VGGALWGGEGRGEGLVVRSEGGGEGRVYRRGVPMNLGERVVASDLAPH